MQFALYNTFDIFNWKTAYQVNILKFLRVETPLLFPPKYIQRLFPKEESTNSIRGGLGFIKEGVLGTQISKFLTNMIF